MTRDAWVTGHPYLKSIATVQSVVEAAADEEFIPDANIPCWSEYQEDFIAGLPLLHSSSSVIDPVSAGKTVASVAKKLASSSLPGRLAAECRVLDDELHARLDSSGNAVRWLLDKDSFTTACPGLLQYLGWTVFARHLSGVVGSFNAWRDEEQWLRNYCPLCGAAPNMAQLVRSDSGHIRFLSCGCCGARWQYRRTGCPFCATDDDHRLSVLAIEGEGTLRLDYCNSCQGYLKTYVGEGDEKLLLSDWTSLHLDFAATNRGLKRLAMSLYRLEPTLNQPS